jgi:hypothetical protein
MHGFFPLTVRDLRCTLFKIENFIGEEIEEIIRRNPGESMAYTIFMIHGIMARRQDCNCFVSDGHST